MSGKGTRKPMGSGGRPPGRIGKGGTGPGPAYKPSKGNKGTTHKGKNSGGGNGSGNASKSVVIGMALLLGVPFLLFLASLGYVAVKS